jgi:AcrR family transcriptional regulator
MTRGDFYEQKRQLEQQGPAQIARALGVSRASVYRHLAAAE